MEHRFTRLKNDVNGNPVYFIGVYDLADILGVSIDDLPAVAKKAGFRNYRGKKYGTGFTVQSYNLDYTIIRLKDLAEE